MPDQEKEVLPYEEELVHALEARGGIVGQKPALTLAARIVQNHLWNRPSRTLFLGPSGCGKTAIWRSLQHFAGTSLILYCTVENFLSANGLNDLFRSLSPDLRDHCILVVDNLEKMLNSPSASLRLLQLCSGERIDFPSRNSQELGFEVDCSTISVVGLACFPDLDDYLEHGKTDPDDQDLKEMGMYPPLAEAMDQVCGMPSLTTRQLALVARNEIDRLARTWGREITVAPQALIAVGRYAKREQLGGKWTIRYVRRVLQDSWRRNPDAPTVHMEYLDPRDDPRALAIRTDDILRKCD